MSIEKGTTDIITINRGNTRVNDVYRGSTLLFSSFPTFTRIYSLRKVISSYSGSCIRIIRISDNTLLDIGFVGNDLDEAAINTFCSGTTCRVHTWYDQSGNNSNASSFNQAGTIIYSGGTIIKRGGKPAINLTTSGGFNITTSTDISTFLFVAENNSASTLNYLLYRPSGGSSPLNGFTINTSYWPVKFGTVYVGSSTFPPSGEYGRGLTFLSGRNLGAVIYNDNDSLYNMSRNGGSFSYGNIFGGSQNSSTKLPMFRFTQIGRSDATLSLNGWVQEVFLGASGSTTVSINNIASVVNNMNSYWSVY